MPDKRIAELIDHGTVDCVRSDTTVLDAVRYMADVKRGAVPVIEGDRLAGMFSERDLMLRVVMAGKDPRVTLVRDVMSRDLVVARLDETHRECLAKMQRMKFRHLPVVDGDTLVGILSMRDLMQVEADQKDRTIEMLNYYVHYSPD